MKTDMHTLNPNKRQHNDTAPIGSQTKLPISRVTVPLIKVTKTTITNVMSEFSKKVEMSIKGLFTILAMYFTCNKYEVIYI